MPRTYAISSNDFKSFLRSQKIMKTIPEIPEVFIYKYDNPKSNKGI